MSDCEKQRRNAQQFGIDENGAQIVEFTLPQKPDRSKDRHPSAVVREGAQ